MSEIPKISVIIPTYKPQGYLWECLDSLCNQDIARQEYEVIIILNGCRDPYYQEIESFIETKDTNIMLLQTDIGGVSNARNVGLNEAHGDYITFIDDDDKVSPSFLKELYHNVDKNIVSICYPFLFDDETGEQMEYSLTDQFNELSKGVIYKASRARRIFNGPWMKLIHKDIIGDRRFDIRLSNGEDGLFNYIISDRIKGIRVTSKNATYFRRFRKDSLVWRKRKRIAKIKNSFIIAKEELKAYIRHPRNYSLRLLLRNLVGLTWVAIK